MKFRLAAFTIILLTTNVLLAVIHHVPGQFQDIQTAVNAALEGDTVMIAEGTYTGVGFMDIELTGRNIVITSESGPDECILDMQSLGRALYIHDGETNATVIEGLTIRRGITFNSGTHRRQGGGMLIDNASPTIRNCIFESDSARG